MGLEVHQNCNLWKCKVVRISVFIFLGAAYFLPFAPQMPDGWKHGISNSLESVCRAGKTELKQAGVCSSGDHRERGHVLSHSNGASECLTRSWSAEQLCVALKHACRKLGSQCLWFASILVELVWCIYDNVKKWMFSKYVYMLVYGHVWRCMQRFSTWVSAL